MADDESLDPFPVSSAWSAVSAEAKSEVTRLAKVGQQHPDRQIAAAAFAWAEVLLGHLEVEHEDRWWNRLARLAEVLYGLEEWLERRADRRWAERVLRAGMPH